MNLQFYRNKSGDDYALRGNEKPTCLIFAEGDAEAIYLEKWLSHIKSDPISVAVVCYKGGAKLPLIFRKLSEEENFSNVTRFGFLLDAEDKKAADVAGGVSSLLKKHNIISGKHNLKAGTPATVGKFRIALCVSPNNDGHGCIDDVVKNEILTTALAPAMNDLAASVKEIMNTEINSKSIVQAYLGVVKPGLCGTGRGFYSNHLNVMHDAYFGIRETLQSILKA